MEINKTEFLEAGVQFGHYKRQWNPKMKKFIFSTKNRVHIMDFKQILEYSNIVCQKVEEIAADGNTILFVGSKKQVFELMKKGALECDSPFMTKKWPGGFLTNFSIVSKEIDKLSNLDSLIGSSRFSLLSKKDQIKIEKKRNKLRDSYEGVSDMRELPKFLFIMGLKSEMTAVREARALNIPIISICDTDTNPDLADYMIPGNDDGIRSIAFFINMISSAIKRGKNIKQPGIIENDEVSPDSSQQTENLDSLE